MDYQKIYIFALAATGGGISGGDRIFIEFARRWSKTSYVTIFLWEEGAQMCKRAHLDPPVKFIISKMEPWKNFGFFINYLARIIEGVRIGLTFKLENNSNTIVYSASDFWMDSLPAFILKMRFLKIKWTAAWYQTAPNPTKGFTEGKRDEKYYLSSLLYWLVQFPIRPVVGRWADLILINNESERQVFPKKDKEGRVMVVLGAVDLEGIKNWKVKLKKQAKVYDGVFQGRFHPQKGVLELIDIWKLVVDQVSDAKLVMIGDGPLMENVKIKIQKSKLENNVILTGYLFDGEEKYRIFSQSKLVVHPAFYDSGGMAAAEAMAFGLPAVGFALKSFKSYYPKGMIKVKIGDIKAFAKTIVELLKNVRMRTTLSRQALKMIEKGWSWDNRAKEVFLKINSL